ncbi:MAG: hypothetical protein HQK96_07775 [Nitrospirae bacterium]|nr:hypothetical protein [Nitrospirota bacterium]
MTWINIDLRFADVLYELSAAEQYIASFERQLPLLVKQEREKLMARIKREGLNGDDDETAMYLQEFYDLTDNVLPRFFRGTIIVTVWTIFEAGVTNVARQLKSEKKKTLDIYDLKGMKRNFLRRAKNYFTHILNHPLDVNSKEWKDINMLQVLRHAIVHCNGRLDSVSKESRQKIKKIEGNKVGLSTDRGYLMFSEKFVEEIFRSVDGFLKTLIANA